MEIEDDADHPWGNGLGDNTSSRTTSPPSRPSSAIPMSSIPTSIADVRPSYLNWNYDRTPPFLGINAATKFGWPSYMNFAAFNGFTPSTGVPETATSWGPSVTPKAQPA